MWLVLFIASLGWVFDVYEGQIFIAAMSEVMSDLLPEGIDDGEKRFYNNIILGAFLVGGAVGGIVFGALSDKIGRTKTMILTILMYSAFTCVSSLSQNWWQFAILRFFVAMGVGGEWAVAAAMVAEVIPARARANCSAIFHASSVFGTYLAALAGLFVVTASWWGFDGWRWAFALGALPALLTLWIRWKLKEPDVWIEAKAKEKDDATKATGHIGELFKGSLLKSTIIGVSLAGIGLATFWGVHVYGKNITKNTIKAYHLQEAGYQPEVLTGEQLTTQNEAFTAQAIEELAKLDEGAQREPSDETVAAMADWLRNKHRGELEVKAMEVYFQAQAQEAVGPDATEEELKEALESIVDENNNEVKRYEMYGMLVTTTGGGLGLVMFGPICSWLGRRKAFIAYHIGGLVTGVVVFGMLTEPSMGLLWVILPIFGFMTLGMHAGYAVYFPELYPTRLRGTGSGFCFNMGRIIAAPILVISGWMQRPIFESGLGMSLADSAVALSMLYLLGVILMIWAPETKGKELPE
jgi:MFS family permease